MSEVKKHTQGRWTVNFTSVEGKCAYSIKEFSGNANEDCANAKLISAAPELLEACELVKKWLEYGDEFETRIKKVINEVIEKATNI
jgi:hypothetical protein